MPDRQLGQTHPIVHQYMRLFKIKATFPFHKIWYWALLLCHYSTVSWFSTRISESLNYSLFYALIFIQRSHGSGFLTRYRQCTKLERKKFLFYQRPVCIKLTTEINHNIYPQQTSQENNWVARGGIDIAHAVNAPLFSLDIIFFQMVVILIFQALFQYYKGFLEIRLEQLCQEFTGGKIM